jgi:hypothetical protein
MRFISAVLNKFRMLMWECVHLRMMDESVNKNGQEFLAILSLSN